MTHLATPPDRQQRRAAWDWFLALAEIVCVIAIMAVFVRIEEDGAKKVFDPSTYEGVLYYDEHGNLVDPEGHLVIPKSGP